MHANSQELAALTVAHNQGVSILADPVLFAQYHEVAKVLACSTLIPESYRNNPANCLLALEVGQRLGMPFLSVTQNLYLINSRPAWSGKYVIAAINRCGRFEPIQFEFTGEPGSYEYSCRAWAYRKGTTERVDGIAVSWKMVFDSGWSYEGSPWNTMRELMFSYRAASFFGNLQCSDILLGLPTIEEVQEQEKRSSVVEASPQRHAPQTASPASPSGPVSFSEALRSVPLPEPEVAITEPTKPAVNSEVSTPDVANVVPAAVAPTNGVEDSATSVEAQKVEEKLSATTPPTVDASKPKRARAKSSPAAATSTANLFDEAGAVDNSTQAATDNMAAEATDAAAFATVKEVQAQAVTSGGQALSLEAIRELCTRAESTKQVLFAAQSLNSVLADDRLAAEKEVVETAVMFIAEETTVAGMEDLMEVRKHLSDTENLNVYRVTFNGRVKALNSQPT